MFTKKSREVKNDFFITFIYDLKERREYIPEQYNKYEMWIRSSYIRIMFHFNSVFPNYYYWHVRHWMSAEERKMQDLLFMIHVYEDHDGVPINRREKWFFNHCWNMYSTEFSKFIVPKLQLNSEGDVPTHEYALAYYKRWLRKPSANFKKIYHGVDLYELSEIIDEVYAMNNRELKKIMNKENYEKRKLKNESHKKRK